MLSLKILEEKVETLGQVANKKFENAASRKTLRVRCLGEVGVYRGQVLGAGGGEVC